MLTHLKTFGLAAVATLALSACQERQQAAPATPAPATEAAPAAPPATKIAATGEVCGTIADIKCGDTKDYCKLAEGACLTQTDAEGVCTKKPEACTKPVEQVCGCNKETYQNECEAAKAGQSIASKGECPKPG